MTATPSLTPLPAWSDLPDDDAWFDTLEVVHLWTQVIGKLRMASSPWTNHGWNVTLYVTPVGLRTSNVPHGSESFDWEFDLLADRLVLHTSTGLTRAITLGPGTIAEFHHEVLAAMAAVDMPVRIHTMPNEIPDAIPFDRDTARRDYHPDRARALLRALIDGERVFQRFRAGYLGKVSPVHFFWGSFDLAVTRFSGRIAPPHGGGVPNLPDDVAREAYSHEVTSCGFWPGNRASPEPIFYAYAAPAPEGFAQAEVRPDAAFWLTELGEFALPYRAVANDPDPDGALLGFCESTHAAAADLGGWERARLETSGAHGPDWWRDRPPGGYGGAVTDRPITYRSDPSGNRYLAELGDTVVGTSVAYRRNGEIVFVHTTVDDDVVDLGVQTGLIRFALDDARTTGLPVVAMCPVVSAWIAEHPTNA